jgi:hypothetical protein
MSHDSAERRQRLSLLVRELHGKEHRAALDRLLRDLTPPGLESSYEIEPLPESDEISKTILGSYRAAHENGKLDVRTLLSEPDLREWLRSRLQAIPEHRFFVYFKDSDKIGVLSCSAGLLSVVGADLLYFDKDTIIAMDTDAPTGFLLDRTVDDSAEVLTAENWE